MDTKEKQELSEIDICDLFITPAIKDAGWKQIRREVTQVTLVDNLVEQAIA